MATDFDFAAATAPEAKVELERLAAELTIENTPETLAMFEKVFAEYPHLHPAVTAVPTLLHRMGSDLAPSLPRGEGNAYREQAFPLMRATGAIYEREVQPR